MRVPRPEDSRGGGSFHLTHTTSYWCAHLKLPPIDVATSSRRLESVARRVRSTCGFTAVLSRQLRANRSRSLTGAVTILWSEMGAGRLTVHRHVSYAFTIALSPEDVVGAFLPPTVDEAFQSRSTTAYRRRTKSTKRSLACESRDRDGVAEGAKRANWSRAFPVIYGTNSTVYCRILESFSPRVWITAST